MARLNVATERKDNKIRIFVTFVLYNHKFSSSDKQQPLAWNEEEKVSGVFKAHHNYFSFKPKTQKGIVVDVKCSATNIRLRSEEHTSELQSLMRISYAVFCLKKNKET